jgi:ubiquinone/menaquinone biosynthesis C-methylase UbiE
MNAKKRIYNTVSDINACNVQKLFDERAKKMGDGYTSVLLGDQNPHYAQKWDEFEKTIILPKMELSGSNSFIDIGCGIGRWAESVIPHCAYYCGCDFSAEMVSKAKERIRYSKGNFDFVNCSFQEMEKYVSGKAFDRGIIAGVCMYINDSELEKCFTSFLKNLAKETILYFTETVAITQRLTLNNFYSEAMHADYSSIYRTPQEYNDFYSVFRKAGFEISEQGFLPHLNDEKEFSETDRWYTILKRL